MSITPRSSSGKRALALFVLLLATLLASLLSVPGWIEIVLWVPLIALAVWHVVAEFKKPER